MSFAIHNDPAAVERAHALAKGSYQHNTIDGIEVLSGGTLRGKAKNYGIRYKQSAANLISRCRSAGIPVSETVGDHGKRILVIG
jgi:hypothetical protein